MEELNLFEVGDGFDNELRLYKTLLAEAKSEGFSRSQCKELAKDGLYKKYPDLKQKFQARFWSKASFIFLSVFPRGAKDPAKNGKSAESKAVETITIADIASAPETFTARFLGLCEAGFVPFGKYLCLVTNIKAASVAAYVSEYRNKYNFTKNEHGWIATKPEPTPEQKLIDAYKGQMDELKRQSEDLSRQFVEKLNELKRTAA